MHTPITYLIVTVALIAIACYIIMTYSPLLTRPRAEITVNIAFAIPVNESHSIILLHVRSNYIIEKLTILNLTSGKKICPAESSNYSCDITGSGKYRYILLCVKCGNTGVVNLLLNISLRGFVKYKIVHLRCR